MFYYNELCISRLMQKLSNINACIKDKKNSTQHFGPATASLYSRKCPARWIRPKVGSFDRFLLKETWQMLFRKIRPSPIEWEPFKARVPSCTVIAHYALNGQCAERRTPLQLRLWFYIRQGFTNGLWKKSFSMAKCGINIFWWSSIILHW